MPARVLSVSVPCVRFLVGEISPHPPDQQASARTPNPCRIRSPVPAPGRAPSRGPFQPQSLVRVASLGHLEMEFGTFHGCESGTMCRDAVVRCKRGRFDKPNVYHRQAIDSRSRLWKAIRQRDCRHLVADSKFRLRVHCAIPLIIKPNTGPANRPASTSVRYPRVVVMAAPVPPDTPLIIKPNTGPANRPASTSVRSPRVVVMAAPVPPDTPLIIKPNTGPANRPAS